MLQITFLEKILLQHGGKSRANGHCYPEIYILVDQIIKDLDETEYLTNAIGFLANQFGCEISVYSADDPSAPDPGNKLKAAMPGRPAIYIE